MSDNTPKPLQSGRQPRQFVVIAVEAALAAASAIYGTYGFLNDDLVVPFRYLPLGGHYKITKYMHFHGAAALMLLAGFLCVAAACIVLIARQLRTSPGAKTGGPAAAALAIGGVCLILVMQFLKLFGAI